MICGYRTEAKTFLIQFCLKAIWQRITITASNRLLNLSPTKRITFSTIFFFYVRNFTGGNPSYPECQSSMLQVRINLIPTLATVGIAQSFGHDLALKIYSHHGLRPAGRLSSLSNYQECWFNCLCLNFQDVKLHSLYGLLILVCTPARALI